MRESVQIKSTSEGKQEENVKGRNEKGGGEEVNAANDKRFQYSCKFGDKCAFKHTTDTMPAVTAEIESERIEDSSWEKIQVGVFHETIGPMER